MRPPTSLRRRGEHRHAVFRRDDRLWTARARGYRRPEITRREVISRVASGEYKNISFIHEIADSAVDDITAEILAEAAAPEIRITGADLQATGFDDGRDLATP